MPQFYKSLFDAYAECRKIRSFDCAALEQVAMETYLRQIQECYRFLKRARSISNVESFKADSKSDLVYLQLLRAAESFGYGLVAFNGLDERFVSKDDSPRNRLSSVFRRIEAFNPKFFPVACQSETKNAGWLNHLSNPVRGSLTRQGLIELAHKSEWMLFARTPLKSEPRRILNYKPEEWISRFDRLLRFHTLTSSEGNQYLVRTDANGLATTNYVMDSTKFETIDEISCQQKAQYK